MRRRRCAGGVKLICLVTARPGFRAGKITIAESMIELCEDHFEVVIVNVVVTIDIAPASNLTVWRNTLVIQLRRHRRRLSHWVGSTVAAPCCCLERMRTQSGGVHQ